MINLYDNFIISLYEIAFWNSVLNEYLKIKINKNLKKKVETTNVRIVKYDKAEKINYD